MRGKVLGLSLGGVAVVAVLAVAGYLAWKSWQRRRGKAMVEITPGP